MAVAVARYMHEALVVDVAGFLTQNLEDDTPKKGEPSSNCRRLLQANGVVTSLCLGGPAPCEVNSAILEPVSNLAY
jgi:hypothetical protein